MAGAIRATLAIEDSLVDELVELPAYALCELRDVDRMRAASEELSEDRDNRVPLSGYFRTVWARSPQLRDAGEDRAGRFGDRAEHWTSRFGRRVAEDALVGELVLLEL